MSEVKSDGFANFLGVNEEQNRKFEQYFELLVEENKHMNLTAITERAEVFEKHFWDSLALGQFVHLEGKTLIDVGTGAGFPGVPLKIAHETLQVTLLDALQKRIGFLQRVCKSLELDEITPLHARAEEYAKEAEVRESYDFATSRAVASLNVLCELTLPFVKVGGSFLAMKAGNYKEELEQAKQAIETLGAVVVAEHSYHLPHSNAERVLILIEKKSKTPQMYPRRFAKIQKSPL